jgi:hypothetical protein
VDGKEAAAKARRSFGLGIDRSGGAEGRLTKLPREARDGLMRAWLKVLSDRHPEVTWVPANHKQVTATTNTHVEELDELAIAA